MKQLRGQFKTDAEFAAALREMQEAGIWVVGLADEADKSLFELDDLANEAICLVLGAEGNGLSRLVRERCDLIVSIPMRGRLSSLNVSAAAALATYEVTRHRVQHLGHLVAVRLVGVVAATQRLAHGVEQLDEVLEDDRHVLGRLARDGLQRLLVVRPAHLDAQDLEPGRLDLVAEPVRVGPLLLGAIVVAQPPERRHGACEKGRSEDERDGKAERVHAEQRRADDGSTFDERLDLIIAELTGIGHQGAAVAVGGPHGAMVNVAILEDGNTSRIRNIKNKSLGQSNCSCSPSLR